MSHSQAAIGRVLVLIGAVLGILLGAPSVAQATTTSRLASSAIEVASVLETRVGVAGNFAPVFVGPQAPENPAGVGRIDCAYDRTAPGSCFATKAAAGACSFGGETRVLMADGTTKPISEVEVGDMVMAQDPETGEVSARKVTHAWVHDDDLVKLEIDGDIVRTTEDHPFWNDTDREWQRADQLDAGDLVLTADGRRVKVGVLIGSAGRGSAFNFTVEGLHTYHVLFGTDAVLVHNACPTMELADNITPRKLDHIFVPKHNLDPLVKSLGSREAVVREMIAGVRGSVPASGVFEIPIQLGGQTVVVRGAIVNGAIRLGTAFTP